MSRAFLTGVVVGVEDAESVVVVIVVNSESLSVGRNGVGMRYMWSMMISTAEKLLDHLPLL